MRISFTSFLIFMLAALASGPSVAQPLSQMELLDRVRTGQSLALIRHALAPGFSDPQNFDVNDCTTQRNLNDVGRKQSRKIGQMFRDAGITQAQVMTSQWCRCRETAKEMAVGDVADLPALNSFFEARHKSKAQTQKTLDWLQQRTDQRPLIFVTHMVNIQALVGKAVSSGEIVVADYMPGSGLTVIGRIKTL